MNQLGSEGFSQNQENTLINSTAHTINFAPTQIIQIVREKVTQRQLIKACPYKGLFKFNAGDKDKFFGRDALIQGFLNAVNDSPLSLILGASGSGKSSVIRAGVIPKLKDSLGGVTFYDFIVEPGEYPFASLYASFLNNEKDYHCNASDVAFLLENSPETLPRAIKQLKKVGEYWLFFIDQFEQVFTNCSDVQMRENFIDGLVQVANLRDSSVKIVLAMRSDFSEYLSGYSALGKILNQNNIHLVTDMHADELRQVIEQPAAKHGVVFEKGLVEQIIKDVQGQKGSLPLLQYTLQLLWEEECRLIAADGRPHIEDRTLNTFNYNVLEGVRGALQKRVNDIYQDQNQDEKIATKQIFLKLVHIDETESGSRAVSQIASRSEFASQEKVLKDLIDAKLLVSDDKYLRKDNLVISFHTDREKLVTVELAHEILLSSWDALRRWIEEEKQTIILRNWLKYEAKRWEKIKKQGKSNAKDELLKGSRLDEIVAFRKADGFSKLGRLSPIENEYIDASVEYRREQEEQSQREFTLIKENFKQEQIKNRVIVGSSLVIVLIGSIGGIFSWRQRQQTEKTRQVFNDLALNISVPTPEIISMLPDFLKEAKQLSKQGEKEAERSIAYYNQILTQVNKLKQDSQKISSQEQETINKIGQEAQTSLIDLIKKVHISFLKKQLSEGNFGKVIKDEFENLDQRFTGALSTSYKILMLDTGADVNKNGQLDNVSEVQSIPCEILKEVEYSWQNATQKSCSFFQQKTTTGILSNFPDCKQYLTFTLFEINSRPLFREHFQDCKL